MVPTTSRFAPTLVPITLTFSHTRQGVSLRDVVRQIWPWWCREWFEGLQSASAEGTSRCARPRLRTPAHSRDASPKSPYAPSPSPRPPPGPPLPLSRPAGRLFAQQSLTRFTIQDGQLLRNTVCDPRMDVAQSGCADRSSDGADQQR
jgi:hypothetical protein